MPVIPSNAISTPERDARVSPSPAHSNPAADLADRLRKLAHHRGLAPDDVRILLASDDELARHLNDQALRQIVVEVFEEGRPPADDRLLRLVAESLGDLLDESVDIAGVGRSSLGRRLANLLGAFVGLAVAYLVIGGLLTGKSRLLGSAGPAASIAGFGALIALLALFEALHISVTQLKTSDLEALAESHPGAVRLHRQFHTDTGIKRFLAGRQLVVVVTVFFAAQITSFPDMHAFPLTTVALPNALHVLLSLGVPGALLTLWVGQLAPQFVATQLPLRLMSSRTVAAAFRVAMTLEAIGLARPGFWLAGRVNSSERVPSSPSLRWRQEAHEVTDLD